MSRVIPACNHSVQIDGSMDEKVWRDEIECQLTCGVAGLCADGSTGEGAGLGADEVYELNKIFVDQTDGRVPVIGGIIPDTTGQWLADIHGLMS